MLLSFTIISCGGQVFHKRRWQPPWSTVRPSLTKQLRHKGTGVYGFWYGTEIALLWLQPAIWLQQDLQQQYIKSFTQYSNCVVRAEARSGEMVWLGNQWVSGNGAVRNSDLLYWSVLRFDGKGDVQQFDWSANCTVAATIDTASAAAAVADN